jgi:hypothetical protein
MPIVIKKKSGEVKVRDGEVVACDYCGYRRPWHCQTGDGCIGGDGGTYVTMSRGEADDKKVAFKAAWKDAVENMKPLPEKGCTQLHKEGA